MAVSERLLPVILSCIFLLLQSSALLPQSTCPAQSSDGDGNSGLICELNDLKLSVARLDYMDILLEEDYLLNIIFHQVADIVSEQWIQIQQLEQAVQITEVLEMFSQYLSSKKQASTCAYNTFEQSRKAFAALKKYHHQVSSGRRW